MKDPIHKNITDRMGAVTVYNVIYYVNRSI